MARHVRHTDGVDSAVDGLATDSLDDRIDLMRNHHRRGVVYGARSLVDGLGLDHGVIVRRLWRSLRLVSLPTDFSGAVSRFRRRLHLCRHASADPDHARVVVWTRLRHGRDGSHDRLENRSDIGDFPHRIDRLSGRPHRHGDHLPTDNER